MRLTIVHDCWGNLFGIEQTSTAAVAASLWFGVVDPGAQHPATCLQAHGNFESIPQNLAPDFEICVLP